MTETLTKILLSQVDKNNRDKNREGQLELHPKLHLLGRLKLHMNQVCRKEKNRLGNKLEE